MKTKIITACIFLLSITIGSSAQKDAKTEVQRPLIKGIAHAGFFTKDVEKSMQFYQDYLGFSESYFLLAENGKDLALSFIKVNDHQYIEIFPDRGWGENHLYHYAIETDDAEGMRKYLLSKGVEVPETTPKGRTGNSNYFVRDPNGTICEIVQYEPNSMSAERIGLDMSENAVASHISHVGFMVPDLDKAISFYCDILGFKEIWRGSKDGKNVIWVSLQVPDGEDYIELMLYDTEPNEEKMASMNHVGLVVDDPSVAASKLESRILPEGNKPTSMITGVNRKRIINTYDFDGTRIEIMGAKTVDGTIAPSSTLPPLKFVSSEIK